MVIIAYWVVVFLGLFARVLLFGCRFFLVSLVFVVIFTLRRVRCFRFEYYGGWKYGGKIEVERFRVRVRAGVCVCV